MAGKKADPQRAQRWAELIDAQAQSHLSVRDFCSERGINQATFYVWRRRLSPPVVPAANFVPVRIVAVPTMEVVLPAGLVVRVPAGCDPASAAQLIAELGGQRC